MFEIIGFVFVLLLLLFATVELVDQLKSINDGSSLVIWLVFLILLTGFWHWFLTTEITVQLINDFL